MLFLTMLNLANRLRWLFLPLVAVGLFGNCAFANVQGEAIMLNKFKGWSVYKGPNNVYFMSSSPESQSGTFSKRENPVLMITDFGDGAHEVSVYVGYTCKAGAPVNGTVVMSYTDPSNVKSFVLQSSGERAWVKSNGDQDVIALFKKGGKVKIAAESFRNTNSVDVYSLDGFSDAYKALSDSRKDQRE